MQKITSFYRHFMSDLLYQNSLYLMASTGVMAGIGFFFWIINARLYPASDIGIATTLISLITLVSNMSLLGFNNALIKYLPEEKNTNEKINTSFSIVVFFSIVFSLLYLIGADIFSPSIASLTKNPAVRISFMLFVIVASVNILCEYTFIAKRAAKFVLIKNALLSFSKLIVTLFLVSWGAYGIVSALSIGTIIAVGISLFFLAKFYAIVPSPHVVATVFRRMIRFSIGNFLSWFILGVPQLILPVLITSRLGPQSSAYFYMDMMIANFLYIIPLAVSQSLFAEGGYKAEDFAHNVKKAIQIISYLLIPGVIVVVLFGNYFLGFFGSLYATQGFTLLRYLALSGVFVSLNYLANAIFSVKHYVRLMIIGNMLIAISILALSASMLGQGLDGIGKAWIIGNAIGSLFYIVVMKKYALIF